ncbi:MAG: Blue-light-activated protein [candidate division BRC1 bacterium ADurb.BinA292]|nr:MAG: Blue-light-activated protein [candidate division BRC1 bacterium ADurb.BinA292]
MDQAGGGAGETAGPISGVSPGRPAHRPGVAWRRPALVVAVLGAGLLLAVVAVGAALEDSHARMLLAVLAPPAAIVAAGGAAALRRAVRRWREVTAELRGMRERLQLFDGMLSSVQRSIFILYNRQGDIVDAWGPADLATWFGLSLDQVRGRNMREFLLAEHARRREQMLACVFEEGLPQSGPCEVLFQGKLFSYEVSISPLRDAAGRVTAAAAFCRETNELRVAESRLYESREALRALLDAVDESAFLIDEDYRLLALNETAGRRLEQPPGELIGRDVRPLWPADTAARRAAQIEWVRRTGEAVEFTDRRNGYVFENKLTPIRDERGRVVKIAIFARDVSERQRAEEELRRSEERYRGIVESHVDLVVRLDLEERLAFVNDAFCRKFGYRREELLGRRFLPQPHPDDVRLTLEVLRDLRFPPYRTHHQARMMTPEGWRWIAWENTTIFDRAGRIEEFQGIGRDVTDYVNSLDALRQSEERYKSIVENTRDLIIVSEPGGAISYASPACEQVLGWSSATLIAGEVTGIPPAPGKPCFVHPEDRERVVAFLSGQAGDPGARTLEYRIVTRDVDVRWVSHAWSPVCCGGKPRQVIHIVRDVTPMRMAEQAERRRSQDLARVYENVPIGLWKLSMDRTRILAFSPLMTEITGLDMNVMFADPTDWVERFGDNPESRRAMQIMDERIAQQLPFDVEYEFRTESRGPRWLQSIAKPATEHGEVVYYGVTLDITERRAMERERNLLAEALNQADEMIIVTDAAGRIVYVNPAFERITGYRREEALGQTPRLIKSGHHHPSHYQGLWGTIREGRVWRGHFINRRRNGEMFEQFATITPVLNDQRQVTHFIGVQRDISIERELERRLRHAQRISDIGQTIMGVSHHLKNILSGLRGSSMLMERGLETGDLCRVRELWPVFQRNTERMSRLADEMLNYARLQRLELAPVDPGELSGEVLENQRSLAEQRRVSLEAELAEPLPRLLCDRNRMYDALLNLVCNAVDACDDVGGGRVGIQVRYLEQERQIEICVHDNGRGIDEETLARIFNPFFTTKGSKGTGLGLAVVQKTVHEHGGRIEVTSRPGRTCFTMWIPVDGRPGGKEE